MMDRDDHENTMSKINKLNELSKKAAFINKNNRYSPGQSKESMAERSSSSS